MDKDSSSNINLTPVQSRYSKISESSTYIPQSLSYSFQNQRRNTISSLRVFGEIYTFGKDSPKWTIPSSRPQKIQQIQSPGPGEYNVTSSLIDNKRIYNRMSLTSHEKTRDSLTASIDFIDRPSLINKNSGIVIGQREKIDFAKTMPGPGPGHYSPQLNKKPQSHLIASRHNFDHSNEMPGPGSYDISRSISDQKGGSLPVAPSDRSQWMNDGIEKTPGPSHYSPIETKTKSYFGNKHSKSLKSGVVAIGRCIVKLNKFHDQSEAKKYIQTNKKLKEVIDEIYQIILDSKPENPLQYIREYFIPEKPPPPPMEEEEEDYLLY